MDVFFVISGYLITTIIINELEKGKFSLANFYERRARRILPALVFVVLACLPAAWFLLTPSEMKRFSLSLVSVALFSSNILFWRQSGYFDTAAEFKPLIHTWSLAVEEQYYILFPVFLMLVWRFARRALIPILVALFTMSLLLAELSVRTQPDAAFFLLPTRGWELLLGAFCAFASRRMNVENRLLVETCSSVGLLLIALAVFSYDKNTYTPSLYTLVPTLGAALIIVFSGSGDQVSRLLSNRYLVLIGLASYSIYLWHQPLFAFLRHAVVGEPGLGAKMILIGLSFALGFVSLRLVEKPFRNRSRISSKSIAVSGMTGMFLVAGIGLAGIHSEGFFHARSGNLLFSIDRLVQQARNERQLLIRAGTCHYDENLPIGRFIENWNCRSDDEELFDSKVLVFGDSHAADKVVALRLNGLDALQVTGAGCQVAPGHVKQDRLHCLKLFDLLLREKSNANVIMVANRFAESELNEAYIEEILQYWGGMDIPVVLFSPSPDFARQHEELVKTGRATYPPSFERENRFFDLLGRFDLPDNIRVLKASDYWCPRKAGAERDNKVCSVYKGGTLLMTDEDHLAEAGARNFGKLLSEDSVFKEMTGLDKVGSLARGETED